MCFSGSWRLFSSPMMARRSRSAAVSSEVGLTTKRINCSHLALSRRRLQITATERRGYKSSVTSALSATKNRSCPLKQSAS